MSLSDSHYFDDVTPRKFEEMRKLLDSSDARQKLESMKRLIALISMGKDASIFYPDVIKNVICTNLDVKKLVYMFLIHYSEQKSDIALLSVNAFQKDLSNPNQLIRAQALRVLTSIRVKMIAHLQVLAIKNVCKDSSPYVRKAAALAVTKVFSLEPELKDSLLDIVEILLGDNNNMVLGSAVAAFNEVCADRIDLLHPHFRKLCRQVADCDEWSQSIILSVLIRYSRTQFTDPNIRPSDADAVSEADHQPGLPAVVAAATAVAATASFGDLLGDESLISVPSSSVADVGASAAPPPAAAVEDADATSPVASASLKKKKKKPTLDSFYEDDSDDGSAAFANVRSNARENVAAATATSVFLGASSTSRAGVVKGSFHSVETVIDEDLRLLLRCVEPLLRSRNSAVVLAVISLFHSLAPTCDVARAMKSLVRLLRSQFEVQWVVLQVISSVIHLFSDTFRPYIKDFYVKGIDASDVACCKLHIITRLVDSSNFAGVLRELQACIRHCIDDVASAAVRALGQCAHLLPSVLPSCVAGLMQLVKTNANTNVLPECVVVIRALVASKPEDNYKLIRRLARMFSSLSSSAAKAAIIWMVAEYGQAAGVNSLELLRVCARSFISEISQTKLQILSFASKLYAAAPQDSRLLYKFIISLANADVAFDIRDRARMMKNILGSGEEGEDVTALSSFGAAMVSVNKVVPVVPPVHAVPATTFSLESLSFCLGKLTPGYNSPAPFPLTSPDGGVRDVSSKTGAKSAAVPSLQAFYADKEKSSSESGSVSGSDSSSEATSSSGSVSTSEDEDDASTSDDDTALPATSATAVSRATAVTSVPRPPAPKPLQSDGLGSDKKQTSTLAALFAGLDTNTPATSASQPASSENVASAGNMLMMRASLQLPVLPTPSFNILHFAKSHGLHIDASIPRSSSVYGREFSVVRLTLLNQAHHLISSIAIVGLVPGNEDVDGSGQRFLKTPAGISELYPGSQTHANLHVHADIISQPIRLEISTSLGVSNCVLTVPIGETLQPAAISIEQFDKTRAQLTGMLEFQFSFTISPGGPAFAARVLQALNLSCIQASDMEIRCAGNTLDGKVIILHALCTDDKIFVCCENPLAARRVSDELKKQLVLLQASSD